MPAADYQTRLAALRRHDTTGFYSSDEPASGEDSSHRVTVTVDPTNRISDVTLRGDIADLREPRLLVAALHEAAGQARAARLAASRPDGPTRRPGERPTVRAPQPTIHRVENYQETGRAHTGELRGTSGRYLMRPLGQAVGTSHNDCVRVTLDLGSSHGSVEIDRGWLANARPSNIGAALTEAFVDAYRKQDGK